MTTEPVAVRNLLRTAETLPTLPAVVQKLTALAATGTATTEEMAKIVNTDQVLAGKVLKLVNSALFGFSGRIATVSGALILLGVNVVRSLAVSSAVLEIMEKHVLGLWTHSMGVAAASNVIATRLKLPDIEEISTAGLLHDIGKVVVKMNYAAQAEELAALAEARGVPIVDIERLHLGLDHAEVGGQVATHWRFPERLIEPITWHHDVARSINFQQRTAVVHLADILVRASAFDGSLRTAVPQLQPTAWNALQLTRDLVEVLIDEVEERLTEVMSFQMGIQPGHDH